jgi:predicted lipoprotein with Yx(FWY)xxD motif
VAASAKPVAGPGAAASRLGTIKRPDGKTQVTYGGKPLYRFSGDRKAGDVNGQGNGGIWWAIAPSGAVVKKAA